MVKCDTLICKYAIKIVFPSVPDAPPQNVMTMVLSSTEIEVTWEEVPAINRSGIITMYEVQYDPLDTFGDQIAIAMVDTSGPVLMTNLTGLEEYVEYNISVRAHTSPGPGPYSDPVTVRTLEDGRLITTEQQLLVPRIMLYRSSRATSECNSHCFIIY